MLFLCLSLSTQIFLSLGSRYQCSSIDDAPASSQQRQLNLLFKISLNFKAFLYYIVDRPVELDLDFGVFNEEWREDGLLKTGEHAVNVF